MVQCVIFVSLTERHFWAVPKQEVYSEGEQNSSLISIWESVIAVGQKTHWLWLKRLVTAVEEKGAEMFIFENFEFVK